MTQHILMLLLSLASLLFWGWQTGILWLAGLLALFLLGAWLKRGTYNFEVASFYHIANFCALIVAVIFALYWLDDRASTAILPTVRLLPLAVIPLLLVQYLHKTHTIPSKALLLFQRKTPVQTWFDVSSLFVFTCVFSAGAIPHQGLLYFMGASSLLLALLLVQHRFRQKRQSFILVLMFLLASLLGLVVIDAAQQARQYIEDRFNAWLLEYNHDGSKASTAIGEVGRLKLSDTIIFRVQFNDRVSSLLLLEGTYQRYRGQTWFGGAWQDKPIPFKDEAWVLRAGEVGGQQLQIFQSVEHDKYTLPLPFGAVRIQELDVASLKQTQGDRFEAQGLPPFLTYNVSYQPDYIWLDDVKRSDLDIPKHEAKAVAQFVKQHHLNQIKQEYGTAKAIEVLYQVFLREFRYSTWQRGGQKHESQTALARFLLNHQQGHCELFATATVLVLRELGIPSRYAVGYYMSERVDSSGLFVVRGRDAHAWAVAKVDGQWVNVDNTPPNWFAIEHAQQGQLQWVWDWFSDISFAFKQWRYHHNTLDKIWWFVLLILLFVYLATQVLRRVRTKQGDAKDDEALEEGWRKLEQGLTRCGLGRKQGETVYHWLARIEHGRWSELGVLYNIQHYAEHDWGGEQQQKMAGFVQEIQIFYDQYKIRA